MYVLEMLVSQGISQGSEFQELKLHGIRGKVRGFTIPQDVERVNLYQVGNINDRKTYDLKGTIEFQ